MTQPNRTNNNHDRLNAVKAPAPKTEPLLTPAEWEVMSKITEAWNAFMALPRCHPMETQEGCTFIHGLQGLVMNRAAVRAYPDAFRSVEGFE